MRNIKKLQKLVVSDSTGCVYGSYIHGLFDKGEIAGHMIQTLAREKGIILEAESGKITAPLKKDSTINWRIPCGNICIWRTFMECSEKPIFHNYTRQETGADPDHGTGGSGEKSCGKNTGILWQNRWTAWAALKPLRRRLELYWDGTDRPSEKGVLIFCADNGIVEEGVSQTGQEVTLAVAKSMARKGSSVCKMAQSIGAETIPCGYRNK
mgnify:CR=1 FL=1